MMIKMKVLRIRSVISLGLAERVTLHLWHLIELIIYHFRLIGSISATDA